MGITANMIVTHILININESTAEDTEKSVDLPT